MRDPRFVRLPAPLAESLARSPLADDPSGLPEALTWGYSIARAALAFRAAAQLYAGHPTRKQRISLGRAEREIVEAQTAFGLPLQQVVTACLHYALTDAYSRFLDPDLRALMRPDP